MSGLTSRQLSATTKQVEFIEKLCAELGFSIQHAMQQTLGAERHNLHGLNRGEASRLIEDLLMRKMEGYIEKHD